MLELGGASRQVERVDSRVGLEQLDHPLRHLARHDLRALGAGVDVAVTTRHVAELADVDLKGSYPTASQATRLS